MRNQANRYLHILLIPLLVVTCQSTYGQSKCRILTEYKNEIKIWAASTIDSLQKQGIDTILFYGVGIPESGWVAYGKIIWANKGVVNKVEMNARYINKSIRLTIPKYDSFINNESIQFYSQYRLDTVKTLPMELTWRSHDYLHYVYSTIQGVEVCFVAENYLLRDYEHLRSRWIQILSENQAPWELGH